MLTKLRGYNCQHATWRSPLSERGMWYYVDAFEHPDGAPALTYDQWCAALAAHGVNWIQLRLTGWYRVWDYPKQSAIAFEPPPYGTYNLWQSALDPANLVQYRADQWDGGTIDAGLRQRSNLCQLVDACQKHGVKLSVYPFENTEWRQTWAWHAWNANNSYVNGQRCQVQDRGFASDIKGCFATQAGIDAAKRRVDALFKVFEGTGAVANWEIMTEMTYLASGAKLWGEPEWNPAMVRNVRDILVPWVSEMAKYIKSKDPQAQVGNGQAWWASRTDWPSNPDHMVNVINELYEVPELDFVMMNWYESNNLTECIQWLRRCQDRFQKQVVVAEYAPFSQNRTTPYKESAPFAPSKAHEWLLACGEYGVMGPMRWPGLGEDQVKIWNRGGYADPDMMEIAGVTWEFAADVDLADWTSQGQSWDGQIVSPGMNLVSSWSDGAHVTLFARWPTGGDKSLAIAGLKPGEYSCDVYDWLDGDRVAQVLGTAAGGVLDVSGLPARDGSLAAYVYPVAPVPPPSQSVKLIVSDPKTSEQIELDLEPGQDYTLRVQVE